MSVLLTRGLADDSVTGAKFKLANMEYLRARNAANSADINIFRLNASNVWEFATLPQYSSSNIATESYVSTQLGSYVPTSSVGANSGVCPLDGSGKVSSIYLPSYVDDVVEAANFAALPVTGETGKIYVTLDTNKQYRWSGSAYVQITSGAVDSVNGATGIVVLSTTDISEGTNLYYTSTRFDTAFSGKSTTNLSEGTNLYFTDARAKSAAVVNSTAGSETDQAASVSAMKSYVTTNASQVDYEYKTLIAGDITAGYIDLLITANKVISVDVKGFPNPQWLSDDYSISLTGGAGGKTRVTFAGDMLTLVAGDKIKVTYKI